MSRGSRRRSSATSSLRKSRSLVIAHGQPASPDTPRAPPRSPWLNSARSAAGASGPRRTSRRRTARPALPGPSRTAQRTRARSTTPARRVLSPFAPFRYDNVTAKIRTKRPRVARFMAFAKPEPPESTATSGSFWKEVAHTGFEPVVSALRGRCPRPLDECARPERLQTILHRRALRQSSSRRRVCTERTGTIGCELAVKRPVRTVGSLYDAWHYEFVPAGHPQRVEVRSVRPESGFASRFFRAFRVRGTSRVTSGWGAVHWRLIEPSRL
jgi:hypothetical protein